MIPFPNRGGGHRGKRVLKSQIDGVLREGLYQMHACINIFKIKQQTTEKISI